MELRMEFGRIAQDKKLAETFLGGFKRNIKQGSGDQPVDLTTTPAPKKEKCQISPSDSLISPSFNGNGWSEVDERETVGSSVYSELDEESDGVYVISHGIKTKISQNIIKTDYPYGCKMMKARPTHQLGSSIKDSIQKFEAKACGTTSCPNDLPSNHMVRANDQNLSEPGQLGTTTATVTNRYQYPRVKEPNIINKSIILPTRNGTDLKGGILNISNISNTNFFGGKKNESIGPSPPECPPLPSGKISFPKMADHATRKPVDDVTADLSDKVREYYVGFEASDIDVDRGQISSPVQSSLSSSTSWSPISDDQYPDEQIANLQNRSDYKYSKLGHKNDLVSSDLRLCKNFPSSQKGYSTLPSLSSSSSSRADKEATTTTNAKTMKAAPSTKCEQIHNTLKLSSEMKRNGFKDILKNFENSATTDGGRLYRWPSTQDLEDIVDKEGDGMDGDCENKQAAVRGLGIFPKSQPESGQVEKSEQIYGVGTFNGTMTGHNLKSILKKSGNDLFDTMAKIRICLDEPPSPDQLFNTDRTDHVDNIENSWAEVKENGIIPKAPKLPKQETTMQQETRPLLHEPKEEIMSKIANGHQILHISDMTVEGDVECADAYDSEVSVEMVQTVVSTLTSADRTISTISTIDNSTPLNHLTYGRDSSKKKVKSSKSSLRPKLPQVVKSLESTKSIKSLLQNHVTKGNGELTDDSSLYDEDNFVGIRDVTTKPVFLYSQKGTVRGVHNRVLEVVQNFVDANMAFKRKLLSSEKVVLYTTSCTAVRETFLKSKSAKALLKAMLVRYEERDCYINDRWTKDLKILLKCDSTMLPQIFVNGHNIGGYKELEKLNEAGELKEILERYKAGTISVECVKCGDFHFVLCSHCHGSKRSSTLNVFSQCNGGQKAAPLKCAHCEETGLVRCDNCYD